MGRPLQALAMLLTLAGCNTDIEYKDSLAGLANISAASAPLDAPVQVQPPVALVPSDNTVRSIAAYDKFMAESPMTRALAPDGVLDEGDPRRFITAATGVLRRVFPDLVLVDDLATAQRRGFRTALVLDLRAHHLTSAFDTNRATIILIVLANASDPVSRIVAEGTSSTSYGSMNPHWGEAVDRAVAMFEDKVQHLLR